MYNPFLYLPIIMLYLSIIDKFLLLFVSNLNSSSTMPIEIHLNVLLAKRKMSLNELSEKGTLLGHKVIDYKTQSKIRLTTAIKIIRWKTRKNANRVSKYYFQHCSYSKNLSKSDYMLIRHIEHTLDLNL